MSSPAPSGGSAGSAAGSAAGSGSSGSSSGTVVVPVSSPHDPHAYRIATLSNGLTCMLINDKPKSAAERAAAAAKQRKHKAAGSDSSVDRDDADTSASKPAVVALSVRVGHWSDPPAIPGLAHFLEHMLFMGNQEFPSENEWEEYLSEHGGSSNAFTDSEYTCYYFEINPAFLHPALHRFAQFFVAPLFAPSATKREIRAVDSEFQDCINSDPERVSELLNYTAGLVNPDHPFSKWGWGNKDSLETNLLKQKKAATIAPPPQSAARAAKGAKGKQGKGAAAAATAAAAAAAASSAGAAPPAVDLRTELKSFHSRYYSSHAMKLVVYNAGGKLDKLQRWVETEFAAIKHNQMPLVDFSHCGHPFRSPEPQMVPEQASGRAAATTAPAATAVVQSAPKQGGGGAGGKNVTLSAPSAPRSCLQHFFHIVPIKEIYKLNLSWVLSPSLQSHYASKPLHYAEHLLGHEGAGSLYSLLRDQGWITSLVAGVNESGNHKNRALDLMQLSVSMTREGSAHANEIIDLVFQYLSLIRAQPGPVREGVWRELQSLSEIAFLFSEASDPSDMVQDAAINMHIYPPAHTIQGDFLHERWDGQAVSRVLEQLSVENCRFDIVCPEFKEKPGLLKAPWFHTQYCSEPVPAPLLAQWSRYDAQPDLIDRRLHLPKPNPFVPTDFAIKQHECEEDRVRARRNAGPQRVATGVTDLGAPLLGEYWWHLDSTFHLPRAHVHLLLESPVVYSSALHVALCELLLKVWVDYLSEYAYAASLAELEFSVESLRSGIEFKFAGFNHKLLSFVEKVLAALGELEAFLATPLAATRFASLAEKTTRHFAHLYFVPLKQANHARLSVLQQRKYSVESITAASRTVTIPMLVDFIRELRSKVRVVGLVDGNVARTEAEGMFAAVERSVLLADPAPTPTPAPAAAITVDTHRRVERTLMLPQGHTLYVEQRARNTRESNHALEAYFAIGPASVSTRALLNMLESLLAEPCFDQLRTREQLGYKVQSGTRNTHGVLGFVIAVQSSAYDPLHLARRVHAFLFHTFYPYLLSMPAAKFATSKASLVAEFLYADSALSERIDRQWEEISDQKSYVFARPALNAQQLHTVTHEQVVQFFEHYFLGIREQPPVAAPVADLANTAENGVDMEIDAAMPAPSPSPSADAADAAAAGDAVLPDAVSALQLSPAEEEAKRKQERKNNKKQRKAASKGGAAAGAAAASSSGASDDTAALDAQVSAKVQSARQAPILYRRAMVVCIFGNTKTKKQRKRGDNDQDEEGEEESGEDDESGEDEEDGSDESGSEDDESGEDGSEEEEEEGDEEEEDGGDASDDDESQSDPSAVSRTDSLWLTPTEWELLLHSQLQKEADNSAAEVAPRPLKKQKNGRNKQTATTPSATTPSVPVSFPPPPRVQLQLDDGLSQMCACASDSGASSGPSSSSAPAPAPSASASASHPAQAQGEHSIRLRTEAALEAAKQASTFYDECNGPEKDLPANARAES